MAKPGQKTRRGSHGLRAYRAPVVVPHGTSSLTCTLNAVDLSTISPVDHATLLFILMALFPVRSANSVGSKLILSIVTPVLPASERSSTIVSTIFIQRCWTRFILPGSTHGPVVSERAWLTRLAISLSMASCSAAFVVGLNHDDAILDVSVACSVVTALAGYDHAFVTSASTAASPSIVRCASCATHVSRPLPCMVVHPVCLPGAYWTWSHSSVRTSLSVSCVVTLDLDPLTMPPTAAAVPAIAALVSMVLFASPIPLECLLLSTSCVRLRCARERSS